MAPVGWLPLCLLASHPSLPAPAPPPCRPRALDAAAAGAQLGLEAGETVLECFACRLWQTYTATNNFFTPVRQVGGVGGRAGRCSSRRGCRPPSQSRACRTADTAPAACLALSLCQVPFPGSLVVTSQRLCFAFEEPGLAPARVPAKALKVAAKLPADEDKGEGPLRPGSTHLLV